MNVKITYTVPMDRIPSKIDELLLESGKNLEGIGGMLRPNQFDEDSYAILQKLDLIEKMREQIKSVDLTLADCYTILAGYNKLLADMKLPNREELNNGQLANEGGSGSNPTESGNGKAEGRRAAYGH